MKLMRIGALMCVFGKEENKMIMNYEVVNSTTVKSESESKIAIEGYGQTTDYVSLSKTQFEWWKKHESFLNSYLELPHLWYSANQYDAGRMADFLKFVPKEMHFLNYDAEANEFEDLQESANLIHLGFAPSAYVEDSKITIPHTNSEILIKDLPNELFINDERPCPNIPNMDEISKHRYVVAYQEVVRGNLIQLPEVIQNFDVNKLRLVTSTDMLGISEVNFYTYDGRDFDGATYPSSTTMCGTNSKLIENSK